MARISVIVPVYNVEKYIRRCIDSILEQTFQDFELILINDGSTDVSGEICKEYETKDCRIHVLNQDNGGAASARNKGLDWVSKNSNSNWIAFVDSDDWIHQQYLELLWKAVVDHNVLISQCGVFDTNGRDELPLLKGKDSYLISAEEANSMVGAVAPTRKLYNRECFEFIRYPEGKLFEDEFVTYKILFAAKRIAFVEDALYYYYVREGSLMHSTWNSKYLDVLDAYKEQILFFSQNGYVNSEKRTVINMVNTIIVQFHNASHIATRTEIKVLKKEMRLLLRKYRRLPYKWLSFRNNQGAYEVLYPRVMWIYWVSKSKVSKILRKRK